ncbi:MAG: AGE family epimerase/isomerase, partial [Bacteroidales bacterium]|nr:AGE family epimerase/isomerase [Bacteroidales bacterium]
MNLKKLERQYKNELLDNIVPFWLDKSQDEEYGGYFTCLDRKGNVFDTDKFMWLQGRQVWMFSTL